MSHPEQEKAQTLSFEEKLLAYDQDALFLSGKSSSDKATATARACAVAFGAVLGLAQPSLAAIHYSGPRNLPLNNAFVSQMVDFTSIGQATDFSFDYTTSGATGPGTRGNADGARRANRRQAKAARNGARATSNNLCLMYAQGGAEAVCAGSPPSYSLARNFPVNYNINSALSPWRSAWSFVLNGNWTPWGTGASFNSQTGYVGVRVPVTGSPGHFYYGWIRYRGNSDGTGTIIDWAYEDQQDVTISAGATGVSSATPIPALDEWGALLLFALLAGAGLTLSRRGGKRSTPS